MWTRCTSTLAVEMYRRDYFSFTLCPVSFGSLELQYIKYSPEHRMVQVFYLPLYILASFAYMQRSRGWCVGMGKWNEGE